MHEDSESDRKFSNFVRKSVQKRWFITRCEYISIYSKMWKFDINPCFWPFLDREFEKIKPDLESSSNFTSTCSNPKIENHDFSDFRANSFLNISMFKSDLLNVLTAESQKTQIFNFWISLCRRKITRGFRIWLYFFEFSMKKWSKTEIYVEFSHFRVYRRILKSRNKSRFLTTFAYKIWKSKVRFEIPV